MNWETETVFLRIKFVYYNENSTGDLARFTFSVKNNIFYMR